MFLQQLFSSRFQHVLRYAIKNCHHCEEKFLKKDLVQHLSDGCPCEFLTCSNSGCTEVFQAQNMPDHLLDCPYQIKICQGSSAGCKFF